MKVAYLGPAGTFSSDALEEATAGERIEGAPAASIYDAIVAVENGDAERALVPFENSTEGSVRSTLDALAFDTADVAIVGEYDFETAVGERVKIIFRRRPFADPRKRLLQFFINTVHRNSTSKIIYLKIGR